MQPEQSNMNQPVTAQPVKQSHGMMVGLIVAIVIAVAGLGTSVVAFTMKAADAKTYEGQIAELEEKVETLEPKDSDDMGGTMEEIAENYIYIGDFGVKIKKPENWRNTLEEYAFYNDHPHAVDSFVIKELSDSDLANIIISPVCGNGAIGGETFCFDVEGSELDVMISEKVSQQLKDYFADVNNYSKI